MFNKLSKFFKNKFIRNVIIMVSGTAGAQAITMLLSPIITRVYGPENYGLMGTFMAIVIIMGPIASLTYPIAIVLPKKDSEAKNLILLSVIIAISGAAIVAILLLILKPFIVEWFDIGDIQGYLYLIPVVLLGACFLQINEQWLIRKNSFKVSAKAAILQVIVTQGGKAGIGLFAPYASVLIIISAFNEAIKGIFMFLLSKRNVPLKFVKNAINFEELKEVARKYRDFPKYRSPQVFLNASSQNLPVLMLTAFFGPAAAGFYSIGRTVLNIPSQLIGKSVGDVFYPRISEAANNKEDVTGIVIKATMILAMIGLIPYGIIVAFGPQLFSFVFGEEWFRAGEYARWMALWVYFMFINQPSVKTLPVINAQRFHLIFTIVMLIGRVSVLFLGYYLYSSDIVAVAFFGIASAVLNIALIFGTVYLTKKHKRMT
ncbi:lipopolysaccharide biosynthesis protein [Gracilibacillus salinarum]|uniref:Oligosaccharide flippase family protein n=1 Tax=Gracilibacillus salinarum TaxID=2932255 RepID=A0ABY4GS03_9BACI|nr:oligosaccharide flippase family protein [Gracilibacillus salinarum]UOQ87049.1 oligosaccharide flippase family protein [Gracilibacillus salinarum]